MKKLEKEIIANRYWIPGIILMGLNIDRWIFIIGAILTLTGLIFMFMPSEDEII